MVGFRKNSVKRKSANQYDVKITKEDEKNLKVSHDNQLLNAVNEAQPFQEATDHNQNRQSMGVFLANRKENLDAFGLPIRQPDVSNPTRSRDERPLDTIRSFEYAITHEDFYKERLETPRLGFRPRPDFPLLQAGYQPQQMGQGYEHPVYTAPKKAEPVAKKKGFFGRKKK